MWTRIRKASYLSTGPGQDIVYFASGLQKQFGIESRVISLASKKRDGRIVFYLLFVIAAFTALAIILLPTVISKANTRNKQRVAALVMSCLWVAGNTFFMKAFAHKFPGYAVSYFI